MTRPVELVTDTYTAYPSGENACVDSYLTLKFASEPVLGTSGRIRIVDSRGEAADLIDMSDIAAISETKPQISQGTTFTTAMDAVGSSASGYYRIVYYNAVSVSGTSWRARFRRRLTKVSFKFSGCSFRIRNVKRN